MYLRYWNLTDEELLVEAFTVDETMGMCVGLIHELALRLERHVDAEIDGAYVDEPPVGGPAWIAEVFK